MPVRGSKAIPSGLSPTATINPAGGLDSGGATPGSATGPLGFGRPHAARQPASRIASAQSPVRLCATGSRLLQGRREYSCDCGMSIRARMKAVAADPVGMRVGHLALGMEIEQDGALALGDLCNGRVVSVHVGVQLGRRCRSQRGRAVDAGGRCAGVATEVHREAIEPGSVGEHYAGGAAPPQRMDELVELALVCGRGDTAMRSFTLSQTVTSVGSTESASGASSVSADATVAPGIPKS